MKFVALVSGGKDSIYSIIQCIRNGHEFVSCVHLGAPDSSDDEESYMYQTAASEVVKTLVEECLEVPLLVYKRKGTSVNTSLVYQENASSENDEVEDLYIALLEAKDRFGVEAVSSGAILSTYQRVRIEHVCNRLGLTSLSYLWRMSPQKELLQQMLNDGIEAVIVRAACPPGLIPQKHLNKTLRFLSDTGIFERLHQRYQFHVCGEGGEYESLVIDSPVHKKKLVFDEVVIDETDDGVGVLRILKCHAEVKGEDDIQIMDTSMAATDPEIASSPPAASVEQVQRLSPNIVALPNMRQVKGGLIHTSEIMAPIAATCGAENALSEAQLALQEAQDVFAILQMALLSYGATARDVLFVHLYLSEISHFGSINAYYQSFFGSFLPPSRSCVAVGKGVLPGGRRVLLDCMIQVGSGAYMRSDPSTSPYSMTAMANKTSKLREVLHVQSISHWAPVCVGPYSQVNTLRSSLHFFAGQIGLIPGKMELHPTWGLQLEQCWKNVAAVQDALDGGTLDRNLFSVLIYASHSVRDEADALAKIESISNEQIHKNGGITAGKIDMLSKYTEQYGGYEDEVTWNEMGGESDFERKKPCPALVVSIPEMPKGAIVELEVTTLTEGTARSLELIDANFSMGCKTQQESTGFGWETGHVFPETIISFNENIQIDASVRSFGHRSAASVLTVASLSKSDGLVDVRFDSLLADMLVSVNKVLAEGRTGLSPCDTLHVRLFYVATGHFEAGTPFVTKDDGLQLRSTFNSVVAGWAQKNGSSPATTLVPVNAIDVVNLSIPRNKSSIFLAMQVEVIDPLRMETDLWINKDRDYNT